MVNYDLSLDVLSMYDIQIIGRERNKAAKNGVYRTPFLLTEEMQKEFYNNVICNRNSNNRYFALKVSEVNLSIDEIKDNKIIYKEETKNYVKNKTIGIVGLNNIQWENGLAEIALTIFKEWTQKGLGERAVKLILIEAFNELRLNNVFGECYECNPALKFWKKIRENYGDYSTILPSRKFYLGSFFNSYYFNFNKYVFLNNLGVDGNNGKSE